MKKIIRTLFVSAFLLQLSTSYAQFSVGISIRANIAPPILPVYTQPPCPTDGYLWTPGYWAYADMGYYWVPGVWVRPPQFGFLWTPCYWGYEGGMYGWHPGYWGPHIGFYGGVNYGYGYGGSGFYGGRWEGRSFRYNTAVVNVNTTVIHNTYIDRTVIVNNNTTINRTSYNGPGGLSARPGPNEQLAMKERHVQATADQTVHQQAASQDRNQFATVNRGRPATAAMNRIDGDRFNPQGHASPPVALVRPNDRLLPTNRSAAPGQSVIRNNNSNNGRINNVHPSASSNPVRPVQQQQPLHSQAQYVAPAQANRPSHVNTQQSLNRPQPVYRPQPPQPHSAPAPREPGRERHN